MHKFRIILAGAVALSCVTLTHPAHAEETGDSTLETDLSPRQKHREARQDARRDHRDEIGRAHV